MRQKERYFSPETEVMQLRLEGVIAASDPINNSITVSSSTGIFDYNNPEQDW